LDLTAPVVLPEDVSSVELGDGPDVDPPADVQADVDEGGVPADGVDDLAEALGAADAPASSGDAGEWLTDVDLSDARPVVDGQPAVDDGIRWKDST
jgi:hypothetical protein